MQTGLGSFSLGVKLVSGWVFVCTHWVAERKSLERLRPRPVWALPAWPLCPFLPGLGRSPRRLLPPLSSPGEHFCSTFFWRKTACHCGFAVDPTSCLVSPNSETLQKARVGRWLLPGKGATSLERDGGEKQLNICAQDLLLCVLRGSHIHSPRLQIYTRSHTRASKSHRSAEMVKHTPAPHKYLQVFREGGPRNDSQLGLLQNAPKPHHRQRTAQIHPIKAREQKQTLRLLID